MLRIFISDVCSCPLLISEYYFIGMKSVASVPLDKLVVFYTIRVQLVLRANPYPFRGRVIAECTNVTEQL